MVFDWIEDLQEEDDTPKADYSGLVGRMYIFKDLPSKWVLTRKLASSDLLEFVDYMDKDTKHMFWPSEFEARAKEVFF